MGLKTSSIAFCLVSNSPASELGFYSTNFYASSSLDSMDDLSSDENLSLSFSSFKVFLTE